MGIHKEVRKLFGTSVLNYIISARTAQGYEDSQSATKEERLDIINRWREHKSEYQNTKQKMHERGPDGQETGRISPKGFFQTRHLSFEERKKLHAERQKRREEERNKVQGKDGHRCPFCARNTAHRHTPRPVQDTPSTTDLSTEPQNLEFEEAIHASVAATSRGNEEEDLMIERAIRASVRELQGAQGSTLSDSEALERAIQASIAESGRGRSATIEDAGPIVMSDEEAEHQELLEKAIQQSLREYQTAPRDNTPTGHRVSEQEEADLKRALEASQSSHVDEHQASSAASQAKTEEEIVLEYIKKQSLAEEKHRQELLAKGKGKEASSSAADDEALERAIAESMTTAGGSS